MRRWVGISVAAALGVGTLTSCGVPDGGVFGVLGDGTAVVQMCTGHIDGAELFLADLSDDPHDEQIGRWTADPEVSGFSQFSLKDGGNGWTLNGRLRPRDPGKRYTLKGWTADASWSTTWLQFSQHELTKLKPGELAGPPTDWPEDENAPEPPNRVWTLTDFKAKACEAYGY
ncbi:hypothetical protein OG474_21825 [Kribbella sp. NBC_01505]|uniref:hypothetical protein n=1 Tax=Kribbella sp. NBC_01505 TaxID=2903580 RepID=UPI0038708972